MKLAGLVNGTQSKGFNGKKCLVFGMAFLLSTLLLGAGSAAATPNEDDAVDLENDWEAAAPEELYITINQEPVTFQDQRPLIDDQDRTLVPARFVSEKLGAEVTWHDAGPHGLIEINWQDKELVFHVNRAKYHLNGEVQSMDTASRITENERAVVPLRSLSDALELDIAWEDGTIELSDPRLYAEAETAETEEAEEDAEAETTEENGQKDDAAEGEAEEKDSTEETSPEETAEAEAEEEEEEKSEIEKIIEESSAIEPVETDDELEEKETDEAAEEADAEEAKAEEEEPEEDDEAEDKAEEEEDEKVFRAVRAIVDDHNPALSDAAVDKMITQSEKLDIDLHVLLGLIRVESVFDPNNVSHAGALGLMQLMPGTASHTANTHGYTYSRELMFDPEHNIAIGTLHLRDLMDKYQGYNNTLHMALSAYNMGTGGAANHRQSTGTAVSWFSELVMGKANKYAERLP